jgi:hypothetical protein
MALRCLPSLTTIAILTLCGITRVTAESIVDPLPQCCQVRTTDRRISAAVEAGLRASSTFRDLVDRINTSDVVVYVIAESSDMPAGLDGRLTFVSAAGGFRYVLVRVNSQLPAVRLVSLLGHELQHAREIADAEWIVDQASMAREYARSLGFRSRPNQGVHQTFDSAAAVRAGEQVLRELIRSE